MFFQLSSRKEGKKEKREIKEEGWKEGKKKGRKVEKIKITFELFCSQGYWQKVQFFT